MIEILQPGVHTTIQDPGRKGQEASGFPPSGAFDPFLAAVANRLVGNDAAAPLLEFALTGPTLRFESVSVAAICAFNARYKLNAAVVPEMQAFEIPAGAVLEFAGMEGWFGYLAVSGGLVADRVLGSASTYAAGRIGRRLERRDTLGQDPPRRERFAIRKESLGFRSVPVLRLLPAMHTDLFPGRELQLLTSQEFRIEPQSDRMGIAFRGAALAAPRVLRSAPVYPGVLQVLPTGQILVLGPDGPVTGGYPQAAALATVSWTTLAQLRPGLSVRFQWTSREDAIQMRRYRDALFRTEAAWQRL